MDVKETKMKTQDIKDMGQALQQVQESAKAALAKKLAKASASSEKGKAAVTLPKAPFDIPKKDTKDEGYGSMVSPAAKKAIDARVAANTAALKAKGKNADGSPMKKEALKGDQHKLDHDKDGDIDAADFKKLRNKKKGEKSEVKPRQETDTDKGEATAENLLRIEAVDDDDDDRPHTHALVDKKGTAHGFAPWKLYDGSHHLVTNRAGMRVATSDDHAFAKKMAKNRGGSVITTKAVKLKKPMDHADAKKLVGKSIKGHYHEATESPKWPVYARIMEKQSHTAGATAPEEMDSKDSPSAKKMKKDHKPEVDDTEAKGHVDAAEAGRKGPSAKARPNDNMKGDKNVVNPVKGAVTNGSN